MKILLSFTIMIGVCFQRGLRFLFRPRFHFRSGVSAERRTLDSDGRPGWQHRDRFAFALSLCALCVLCGCASYTSRIRMPDGTALDLPKDAKGSLLVLNREFTDAIGRTNRLTLTLSNYNFSMNPAVIDAKTAHDVAIFQAGANLAGQIGGAAVK